MKLAKRVHKGTAAFTLAILTLLPLKTLTTPLVLDVATTRVAIAAAAPAQYTRQGLSHLGVGPLQSVTMSGDQVTVTY